MTNIKTVFGIIAFILILGLVGKEDFKDEVRSQVMHCELVAAGQRPDYNNTFQYCAKAYEALAKIEGE